eukprot:SAG11_NODE_202_length_12550_cov_5.549835_3_plen_206_part_00
MPAFSKTQLRCLFTTAIEDAVFEVGSLPDTLEQLSLNVVAWESDPFSFSATARYLASSVHTISIWEDDNTIEGATLRWSVPALAPLETFVPLARYSVVKWCESDWVEVGLPTEGRRRRRGLQSAEDLEFEVLVEGSMELAVQLSHPHYLGGGPQPQYGCGMEVLACDSTIAASELASEAPAGAPKLPARCDSAADAALSNRFHCP